MAVGAMLLSAATCHAQVDASKVLLWRKGTAVQLQGPLSLAVAKECQSLLLTANDTVLLALNGKRLEAMKRGEAVEVYMGAPEHVSVNGAAIVFDKILVPMSKSPKEGLILFSGKFGSAPEAGAVLDYGAFTFVVNKKGTTALRDLLGTQLTK